MKIIYQCVECGVDIVSNKAWRKLTPDQKQAANFRCHRGRRLCTACYERALDAGTLLDYEGVNAPADAVLEDAIFLVEVRDYAYRDLPGAFNMKREAFSRMVNRRDAAGDERAHRLRALNPYTRIEA